jgi:hypothetical protein
MKQKRKKTQEERAPKQEKRDADSTLKVTQLSWPGKFFRAVPARPDAKPYSGLP